MIPETEKRVVARDRRSLCAPPRPPSSTLSRLASPRNGGTDSPQFERERESSILYIYSLSIAGRKGNAGRRPRRRSPSSSSTLPPSETLSSEKSGFNWNLFYKGGLRMAPENGLSMISVASILEEVLKQHTTGLNDTNLASRKAEEAASRRYEAAGWLRKTVGAVGAKDLPEAPSEEEFRLGLRNGLILCNALNKVHPGKVPKVVVSSGDMIHPHDGAALSVYQYFENVRNFLVAMQDMGLPTFEVSDLEQGGKGSRTVNCVLALKSYGEWKQFGENFPWKCGGNQKPGNSAKYFTRKSLEASMSSPTECTTHGNVSLQSAHILNSHSLNRLVRAVLLDKKPEEVPILLESVLNNLTEKIECCIVQQNEMAQKASKDLSDSNRSFLKQKVPADFASTTPAMVETEEEGSTQQYGPNGPFSFVASEYEDDSSYGLPNLDVTLNQQLKDIQDLKQALCAAREGIKFMQMKCAEECSYIGKYLHGLATAASGYHKVLEENRKLYNQVQDLKGNIRVYCRVRPFLPGEFGNGSVASLDDGSITIMVPSKYSREGHKTFNFNKVFGPSATQSAVFSDTQPLIRSVLDGYNICIFAYGQTGSGKTYTMSGPKDLNEKSQGVNYRALSDLFCLSEQRRHMFRYEIAVQMIEIYNEQVRDLLTSDGQNRRLDIRNNSQKGLNVPNANLVPVSSTADVMGLMNVGNKNRAVGATALNDRSSRSHSCLTVHVQGRDLASGTLLRGCMHLVDLAGSERVEKSEVTGERLKEARHINKSLSALGDVISALAQKSSHVPYRNSKLTQLLQDSLGGQAKTLMFVHISPEMDAIGETISTLKFAERVSTVELGAARANKDTGEIKELREQLASLKAALARKNGELDPLHNLICIPDKSETSLDTCSPVSSSRRRNLSRRINPRPQSEDASNAEAQSNLHATRKKKPSANIEEAPTMPNHSPFWPGIISPSINGLSGGGGEPEVGSSEWIDKLMVNRHEPAPPLAVAHNHISAGEWDGDCLQLPVEPSYQQYPPRMRNGTRSQDFEAQAISFDTEGSDELDEVMSGSSEAADLLWQPNLQQVAGSTTNGGYELKAKNPNPSNAPEIRSARHEVVAPMQKTTLMYESSNTRVQIPPRGRGSSNGKRASSGGKTRSGK